MYWKLHEYSNIFEYSSRFYTLTHSPTNVRIYSYKQIWHERMSEYIRKRKIDTNECPNIYSWPIYSNIRIYSSYSVSNPMKNPVLFGVFWNSFQTAASDGSDLIWHLTMLWIYFPVSHFHTASQLTKFYKLRIIFSKTNLYNCFRKITAW